MRTFQTLVAQAILVSLTVAISVATAQTIPAGWKEYKGSYFSFRYPPSFTFSRNNDRHVSVSVQDRFILFEIEYTAAFGSNTDQVLAAERKILESGSSGLRASVESVEPGYRGGRCFWATLTASSGAALRVWINAIPAGTGHYVIRMIAPEHENIFQLIENYRNPIVGSITFDSPSLVEGTWRTQVRSSSIVTGLNHISIPPRTFSAALSLNPGETYTYTVRQTDTNAPAWQLVVTGRYTVRGKSSTSDASVELVLRPGNSRFTPGQGFDSTQQRELSRLPIEGLPSTFEQTFNATWDTRGDLWTKLPLQPGQYVPEVIYRRDDTVAAIDVSNAASRASDGLAPGSLIVVAAPQLTATPAVADRHPLPTALSSVAVTCGGVSLPLMRVDRGRVMAQLPYDIDPGQSTLNLVVNGTSIGTTDIQIAPTAPGIFADDNGGAMADNQDGKPNSSSNPARSGSWVLVYITGQGALDARLRAGEAAPVSPLAQTLAETRAMLNGEPVYVSFSGAVPGAAGIAAVQLQVPSVTSSREVPLQIVIGGRSSNIAKLQVAP